MTKVSSTYLSHRWRWGRTDDLNFELFHEQVCNNGANGGTYGCTIDLFEILTLEEEVCVFKAKLKQDNDLKD